MAEAKNYRLAPKVLPEKIELPKIVYDDKWNEDIVETAGFIPLEVRFKQMEQAGFRAQFFESEFSSRDVSDMYLGHPEFDITPEDEIEDVIEKMEARIAYVNQVKQQIRMKKEAEFEEQKKDSEERTSDKKDKTSENKPE